MMKNKIILDNLDIMIKDPKCELEYFKDYELLIATVLSAQTTDKKVNKVTKVLWNKYDLKSLSEANLSDLEDIFKELGMAKKKSIYVKEIAKKLVMECDFIVPNDINYLFTLPGVGRKTANVVLSNIYNIPLLAVDTHVERVSKRLGFVDTKDNVRQVEEKLMKIIPKEEWIKRHHQFVLFGRYICKAIKPKCDNCLNKKYCNYYKEKDSHEKNSN